MHGNHYLLTDVLKTELGFTGFVVSDWAGIDQLPGDYASDIETSINAGIDMVMVPNNYVQFFNTLKSLIQQGNISMERIDDAVSRILRVKFELGLFEHPFANRALLAEVGSPEHRAVARQAVRESMVLLKKNDNILPIPKTNVKILVAGDHADNIGLQCGGWSITWQGGSGNITEGTTILQGLHEVAPQADIIYDASGNFTDTTADYIIAVIGEQPYAEGVGDRTDLTLDRDQMAMVRRLRKLGIPLITILISGRPMIINPVLHSSDAMFAAWLPGTEGNGIADLLFGDYIPSGHLPATWPKSMEQIPINFGDDNYNPLFPCQFAITSYENSQQGSSPVFNSAMVIDNGTKIELSFNKSMNNPDSTSAVFRVVKNGTENVEVAGFEVSPYSDDILLISLASAIEGSEEVSLSYLSGDLKSEDGGVLEPFTTDDVINYLDYLPQPNQIPGRIEAENYSNMFGIQLENTSDVGGGMNVGWIDDGDWLEYECQLDFNGTFLVNFRVASLSAGGKLQVWQNDQHILDVTLPVTGGWQNWQTVTQVIDLQKGSFTIKLVAEQGGFNINWFEFSTVSDVNESNNKVNKFELSQNFPNPFSTKTSLEGNPVTTINYKIPNESEKSASGVNVKITIYNILGKIVATLVNQNQIAGNYSVKFNAKELPSGVYFYRLSAGNFSATKKMLLLK
jgi:beta-glucosidase